MLAFLVFFTRNVKVYKIMQNKKIIINDFAVGRYQGDVNA